MPAQPLHVMAQEAWGAHGPPRGYPPSRANKTPRALAFQQHLARTGALTVDEPVWADDMAEAREENVRKGRQLNELQRRAAQKSRQLHTMAEDLATMMHDQPAEQLAELPTFMLADTINRTIAPGRPSRPASARAAAPATNAEALARRVTSTVAKSRWMGVAHKSPRDILTAAAKGGGGGPSSSTAGVPLPERLRMLNRKGGVLVGPGMLPPSLARLVAQLSATEKATEAASDAFMVMEHMCKRDAELTTDRALRNERTKVTLKQLSHQINQGWSLMHAELSSSREAAADLHASVSSATSGARTRRKRLSERGARREYGAWMNERLKSGLNSPDGSGTGEQPPVPSASPLPPAPLVSGRSAIADLLEFKSAGAGSGAGGGSKANWGSVRAPEMVSGRPLDYEFGEGIEGADGGGDVGEEEEEEVPDSEGYTFVRILSSVLGVDEDEVMLLISSRLDQLELCKSAEERTTERREQAEIAASQLRRKAEEAAEEAAKAGGEAALGGRVAAGGFVAAGSGAAAAVVAAAEARAKAKAVDDEEEDASVHDQIDKCRDQIDKTLLRVTKARKLTDEIHDDLRDTLIGLRHLKDIANAIAPPSLPAPASLPPAKRGEASDAALAERLYGDGAEEGSAFDGVALLGETEKALAEASEAVEKAAILRRILSDPTRSAAHRIIRKNSMTNFSRQAANAVATAHAASAHASARAQGASPRQPGGEVAVGGIVNGCSSFGGSYSPRGGSVVDEEGSEEGGDADAEEGLLGRDEIKRRELRIKRSPERPRPPEVKKASGRTLAAHQRLYNARRARQVGTTGM